MTRPCQPWSTLSRAQRSGRPVRNRPSSRLCAGATIAALAVALLGCANGSQRTLRTFSPAAERGKQVAADRGCLACHTVDGKSNVGPTWQGIWGQQVGLDDGRTVTIDGPYVARAIREPQAEQVKGYASLMPRFSLTAQEIADITSYIEALGVTETTESGR
jgi:cytochrome c551/c552